MKRLILLMSAVLMFCTLSATASPRYAFANSTEEARFVSLLRDLRCLVCQNQDLADSNSAFAEDLREVVYEHLQAGESDAQIVDYLVARFGDFIRFKPPFNPVTALLWTGPLLFLTAGFWMVMRHFRRQPDDASC
ncbi:cytochrome c-type biogenesis protein CcmH [Legionella geestiana]|uniref:Cytochrome c-type biogenesis protein n=1 Tax=Legionella geestiana TaxID=45065 RepID=A0A0W0UA69_9GAMM|nr:cytochrome c-type biogenesis protein [Legionella geestiana]KTD04848.1 cytochrome c-type biogenesis protein CcmH [Legionella geestiana]STX54036.1 cytochrome c-type biogenesis protein CcmH [Legionella geestiana]